MSNLDNKSDDDLIDELENRGYKVDDDEESDGGFGCSLLIGVILLGLLVYYGTIYVHVAIYAAYEFSWAVYLIFAGILILTILTKGRSSFVNFFLYVANIAFLTVLYSIIIGRLENATYEEFFNDGADGVDFMKYAALYVPYIIISTYLLTKVCLLSIRKFTAKKVDMNKGNSQNLPL